MANFNKAALRYQYNWSEPFKNKRHLQFTNYDIIDRRNGYHILDFINRFLTLHGLYTYDYFRKVEVMICRYMPEHLDARGEMKDWLRKNWNTRLHGIM